MEGERKRDWQADTGRQGDRQTDKESDMSSTVVGCIYSVFWLHLLAISMQECIASARLIKRNDLLNSFETFSRQNDWEVEVHDD